MYSLSFGHRFGCGGAPTNLCFFRQIQRDFKGMTLIGQVIGQQWAHYQNHLHAMARWSTELSARWRLETPNSTVATGLEEPTQRTQRHIQPSASKCQSTSERCHPAQNTASVAAVLKHPSLCHQHGVLPTHMPGVTMRSIALCLRWLQCRNQWHILYWEWTMRTTLEEHPS